MKVRLFFLSSANSKIPRYDDTDGALQRLETAVEDGLVDQWWYTMSHPLYDQLQFEPRYLHVRKRIEDNMAEQRERFLEMSQEPTT